MYVPYRTPLSQVSLSAPGASTWDRLPSGAEVRSDPLGDLSRVGFSRVAQIDAEAIAREHEAQLTTMAIEREIWRTRPRIAPVMLTTLLSYAEAEAAAANGRMMSREICDAHDHRVRELRSSLPPDKAFANPGKLLLAPPRERGWLRQGGWFRADGTPWQTGTATQRAHDDHTYTDYSLVVRLVRLPGVDYGRERHDTEPSQPLPWLDPHLTIGERSMAWIRAEMGRKPREVPRGSNAGPRIAEYFERAERDGRPLGVRSGNYCSVGRCMSLWESLLPGETLPHRYRAGVIEMVSDAMAAGAWVPASILRQGYRLHRGDSLVWDRSIPGRTETGWWRHVGGYDELITHGLARTLEANAGQDLLWTELSRPLDDPRLLGAIVYPGHEPADLKPSEDELRRTGELVELSKAVMRGDYGIEALDAAMAQREVV